jgi:hypothetical protein
LSLALEAPVDAPPLPVPVPGGDPHPLRRVVLGGRHCDYRLRRARRRTIGFQIDDRGLTVSAPRWVALRDVEAAIREKERWIHAKLAEWHQWRARRRLPQVRFADGGTLPYLGRALTLRLHAGLRGSGLIEPAPGSDAAGTELGLALPADASESQVRDAVQAWLKAEAQRVLGERLQWLAARGEVRYASWAISSARSQWGSCNADGRIRLNWRLIHFALPVIDYVVAHELAHLKELNHSPRFWREVALLLPGFEAARDHIRNEDLAALPL